MAFGHLFDTFPSSLDPARRDLDASRQPLTGLAHLSVMDAENTHQNVIEPVLTLRELAAHLCVSAQTLYDLRSRGRGPRGFRVGRELRFRQSEIDAWLARLEGDDARPHEAGRQR